MNSYTLEGVSNIETMIAVMDFNETAHEEIGIMNKLGESLPPFTEPYGQMDGVI